MPDDPRKRAAVEPPSPAPAREPGPSVPPVTDGPGTPSSRLLPVSGPPRAAAGTPTPDTGAARLDRVAAPARGRSQSPAGASLKAHGSSPAGSRGLSGAEWRAAAKAAQSKRRQPARSAAARPAAKVTIPPPATGAALTATATCLGGCGWTAGPGDPGEVDKAADAHTTKAPKHATNTVSVVAETGGAA